MQLTSVGLQLGPLTLSYFSLAVVVAVLVGGIITALAARRKHEDPTAVFDLFAWMLILGVVVSRLFYIWNPPPSVAGLYNREWYLTHPLDLQAGVLAVWGGGLGMAGMLVGASLGASLFLRRAGLDVWLWADILVPGLLVALIIAPWGNVLSGQLVGPPTNLPWGIAAAYHPPPYDNALLYPPGTRFHPTPAYLSIWALLTAAGVWAINRRREGRLQNGSLFLMATLIYVPGLFLADFLRIDVPRPFLGLSGMQTLALLVILAVAGIVIWRRRRPWARSDPS